MDYIVLKILHLCCRPWALVVFSAPGARHQGAMVRDISLATTPHTEGTAHIHASTNPSIISLPFLPPILYILNWLEAALLHPASTFSHRRTVCFSFVTLSFICSLSGCPRARKSGIKIIHSKENKEDQEPIRYSADTHRLSSVYL